MNTLTSRDSADQAQLCLDSLGDGKSTEFDNIGHHISMQFRDERRVIPC